jgi:hypothetical protein
LEPITITDARADIEAERIAGELRKLDEAGAFRDPGDPLLYASVIRTFGGTFLPKGKEEAPVAAPSQGRWSAKVLTGNAQPRTREENRAFLMAAFDPEDVFDFSNPSDVEEYKRVNQPIKKTQTKRPSREGFGYREGNN